MRNCEASGIIGISCRTDEGFKKENCALWIAAELEPPHLIGGIRPLVERATQCPFQKDVLEYIALKTQTKK